MGQPSHYSIQQSFKNFKAGKNGFPVSTFQPLESKRKKREVSIINLPSSNSLISHSQPNFPSPFNWAIAHVTQFCRVPEAFHKMKGMKGKFLRKLKSISTITTLKQGLVFQVNPSNQNFQTPFYREQQEHKNNNNPPQLVPGNNVKDEEMDSGFCGCGKENFGSPLKSKDVVPAMDNSEAAITLVSGIDNVCTVPLSAVQFLKESQTCNLQPVIMKLDSQEFPRLLDFEDKCPPGGSESVVLYTTSLRGIRKTFEDCNTIRFLLESFRVVFYERDVSMHLEFREELWRILGGRVVPPRLFIRGRHIGGADEVVTLHEQGKLRKLLQGIPLNPNNAPCNGCAGVRFVLCSNCNGSCKVILDEQANEVSIRCPDCNENGLIQCPICC